MKTQRPEVLKLKGGLFPKYVLLKDYTYSFKLSPKDYKAITGCAPFISYKSVIMRFVIPAGFEYDGATMGSFLFWRKSVHESPHTLAHDWLYVQKGDVKAATEKGKTYSIPRHIADELFSRGLAYDENVQGWRKEIADFMISAFGGLFWKY